MIERLKKLREKAKVAENQLVEMQEEIDDIERGIQEAAVPWYEREWTSHVCTGSNEKTNIWTTTDDGGSRMVAQACDRETARRLVGMQKLVKTCKSWLPTVSNATQKHSGILQALREMGEEV